VRREAKYPRRTPRASELPASEIYERIALDFGRSADIPSVASDDDSEMAERPTSTVTQDPLHEAISSILPGVQPGLFPNEICDRLFVEHKGLISKRCKSFARLKSMIHRILSAMLGQKKLERRSAKTRKGYLGHQYIRTGPCGLHKPRSSEGSSRTESSEVEFVDSYSMASTSCLGKPSHTQAPVTNASGILYDTLSGPVPVQPSDTKFQGSDTSRDPRPRLTPDMRRTLHPSARTPKLQSGSSSSSAQQRIVEDLQTEWKQSIDTLIEKVTPSPGVTAREQDRQNSDSGNLVGQAQHAASVGLTGMSEAPEGTPDSTRTQAICEDHSVLELGKMIREVGKKRQKWVDDAKSFDQKLRNDEQVLDKLLERMNANMKELCRLHAEMETLHSPVESLESKVVALRRQADQTRDKATTVTLQCQAHVESKREAETEFAKADRRLERLVQALIKL
jgi:hypothetical protein